MSFCKVRVIEEGNIIVEIFVAELSVFIMTHATIVPFVPEYSYQ